MATLLEFKCPACGGALNFDSSLQTVKCPYCDTEFEMESLRQLDESLEQDVQEEVTWQEQGNQWQAEEEHSLRTYVCNSCGGQILCDENTAATSCPYCDNPVVMTRNLAGQLKPDLVVPFRLDKEAAKAAFAKHLSGKPLLPKVFKSENRLEAIQGVYVPFWLYDARSDANIQYRATQVSTWSDSDYIYTCTKYYRILRAGKLDFAGVPVDGSSKMPDKLMESIEPYDLSGAVDFQTAYLAGFLADKYDVSSQECGQRAYDRICTSTRDVFASTVIGYSSVMPLASNIHLEDPQVKYALLPVWMLTTRYKDQLYTFAMNGQTGKFVGDLPVNVGAAIGWWVGMFAAGSALAALIGWLISLM